MTRKQVVRFTGSGSAWPAAHIGFYSDSGASTPVTVYSDQIASSVLASGKTGSSPVRRLHADENGTVPALDSGIALWVDSAVSTLYARPETKTGVVVGSTAAISVASYGPVGPIDPPVDPSNVAAILAALPNTYRGKVPGEFVLTDYGKPNVITGDWTAVVNAAQAAMYASGGSGNLYFPGGSVLIAGQITLPNDGNLIPAPTQPPITWLGIGGYYNGQNALGSGGTRLIMTYQGAGTENDAKIVTHGLGVFRAEGIIFQDTTANSATPFLMTTLTTLKVEHNAFLGATAGTSCTQDAIIGGGTLKYATVPVSGNGYGDADAPFQGYGTVIRANYFNRTRRAFYGRSFCNQVVIQSNFMDKGCGTNLTGGACIEFDASQSNVLPGDSCTGNVITDNYFENTGGYYYQIKGTGLTNSYIAGNGAEDASPGSVFVALVGLFGHTISATNYPSSNNTIVGNATQVANVMFEDTISKRQNLLLRGNQTEGTVLPGKTTLGSNLFVGPISGSTFTLSDEDTSPNTLLTISGSLRQWAIKGPLFIDGNSGGAGSTYLTVGNHSTASDALINLDPPSGQAARLNFRLNNVDQYWIYNAAAAGLLFFRDPVNGVMQLTFTNAAGINGKIAAGVVFYPVQAATAGAPTYVKGGMYFDTTLNKLRIGGASAWETVTST